MFADAVPDDNRQSFIRSVNIEKNDSGNCGFHLTRSKWDPYPWVSSVDSGSSAEKSGMKNGDCLLEVNGEDVLGQKISDIANLVKRNSNVALFLWNSGVDEYCTPETICCGPMPRNFQKLTTCTSSILSFLECPICLDTIGPPCYQCDNGHLICIRCRAKSERCPVCRTRFNRGRSLLADQIYNLITDVFDLKETPEVLRNTKMQQIFKLQQKKKNVPDIKITQAHTNKFLAKLVGKSSSVDNLASNRTNSNLSLNDTNLKTKSLSSTQLFDTSPSVSRSSSIKKIYKSSRLDCSRSVSCHNSYESLNASDVDDVSSTNIKGSIHKVHKNNTSPISCPFEHNCTVPIVRAAKTVLEHFQICHSGPLIQYFKPSFRLRLDNLSEKNNTYVINVDNETFFVKILKDYNEDDNKAFVQIWTWHLENYICDNFYLMCQIENKNNVLLITVSIPTYSLTSTSWKDIVQTKRGIIINGKATESTECIDTGDITLEMWIKRNDVHQ